MVPIVIGDGTMSRREADGLCPNCETAREIEQTRCRVCKIILTAAGQPQKQPPLDQRPDLSP